jgi:hypothetical protein
MISTAGPYNTGIAAGGAGVATNFFTTTKRITGRVMAVVIEYNDSPPAGTTDVTVKTQGTASGAPVSYNIVKITNAATNNIFHLAPAAVDQTGSAITSTYEGVIVDDYVTVLIQGADNGDSADVWLMMGD